MNAVIYARYSHQNQNEQSIEGQLKDCYAFAEQEGYTVIGEYIDRARTGRSEDRPEFQRMIKDAEKKKFQFIIVWKLDRFARNRYDSAIYKARLKRYGVKVLSAMEKITDSPEGIILEGMLESLAEFYSANLSQNVKRGQRETMAKGRWCGGSVPYGYKVEDGRLVADERTAPVVRYLFEQYAAGVSKKEILKVLSARGVKSATGKPLGYSSFQHVLPSTTYIGKYIWSGQEIEGCADAIIDEQTFYKVQERLKAVARAPAAGKAKVEYQLQGKIYCGHCGARMIGESGYGRNGTHYTYYTCATRKKSRSCDKRNEKKDFVEWYVVEQTIEYVLSPERVHIIAQAVVDQYDKEFNSDAVQDLERQLDRVSADIRGLVDSLISASTKSRPYIFERIDELEMQREDLEQDLVGLRAAAGIRYTAKEVEAWMRQFCKGDPLDVDFRRRIIDVFINSVYMYDDKTVIFYNLRDGKQVSFIGLDEALDDIEDGAPPGSSLDASGQPRRSGVRFTQTRAILRNSPGFRNAPSLLLSSKICDFVGGGGSRRKNFQMRVGRFS